MLPYVYPFIIHCILDESSMGRYKWKEAEVKHDKTSELLYIENNEIIFGVQRKIGQHLKNLRVLYFKTKKN